MDTWDDDFTEPTEDERSARRAVAVAVALINARRPVTTDYIREEFYGDLNYEAFRKAYQRDRTRLATTGIHIVRKNLPTGEAAWQIDASSSYAQDECLTAEDALVLDCLLLPMAQDPTFPYARDLRMALAKIDHSFSDTHSTALMPAARRRNRQLERIESCITNCHAAKVSYVRADGTKTERSIVPLGLFPLRGTTYLVATRLVDGRQDEPHVYNLDRMRSVRELGGATYEAPDDFSVRDYIALPFEMGPTLYVGEFDVPDDRLADVRARAGKRGTWHGNTVAFEVSNERDAAAWAADQGITPLMPASLVSAWRECLLATAKGDVS